MLKVLIYLVASLIISTFSIASSPKKSDLSKDLQLPQSPRRRSDFFVFRGRQNVYKISDDLKISKDENDIPDISELFRIQEIKLEASTEEFDGDLFEQDLKLSQERLAVLRQKKESK